MQLKKGDIVKIKEELTLEELIDNELGFVAEMFNICFDGFGVAKDMEIDSIFKDGVVEIDGWAFYPEWLEFIESSSTELTKDEEVLLGWLCVHWQWIVRKNERLYIYKTKPHYNELVEEWFEDTAITKTRFPYDEMFKCIKEEKLYKITDLLLKE